MKKTKIKLTEQQVEKLIELLEAQEAIEQEEDTIIEVEKPTQTEDDETIEEENISKEEIISLKEQIETLKKENDEWKQSFNKRTVIDEGDKTISIKDWRNKR